MKKLSLSLAALIIILASSCKKDDLDTLKPQPKKEISECKKCTESWDDLTEELP